ncbi:VENN motif pre-toxin domain-containing protein [Pantoea sp. KPR_PJ]|uniref:VENN motif pre-toxin domain-containing protein n=1 Tax=Pantoea sp. KPR_PJ TaxID=2738375 RepID=UPI003528E3C4
MSGLSRDVAHANQTLSPIFDKEKEQNRLQEAQLIGEIGNQAADIARTEGQIRATNAGKAELAKNGITEPGEGASQDEWASYNAKLTATDSYKAAQQQWGTGSAIQQGIQAATAAVQGLAGGSLAQAASGAAAPYLAEVIKQTAPDEASRIMAHAAVAGVIAAAQGNSALSGAAGAATTAAMGEAIKNALYGNVPVSQLSEEQKQTLVALGTVAAGLAGGLTGNSAADAVTGAQAGQNEISNNMFSAGMLQQMLAQETLNSAAMAEAGKGGANEQAALALTKKVKEGLDAACLANPGCVLMAIVSAQSQQHTNGAGSKTETVPVNDDLTGGKLVNPAADETKGTSLVTPDRSPGQGVSHTGNTEGAPDTGGNTTVTPAFGQDINDYIYLAEGDKPASLSPEGSARAGAFNEAKRQSGIPVSQSPSKVHPNVDKRGNPQPGYIYEFDVPKSGGGTEKIYIRDDAGGHFFGEENPQNRGPHFNDPKGNHYDY